MATGTASSVHGVIPNLEDGLSTRFLYHNLPAKDTVRGEMDEAMAEAMNDVYTHHRQQLTAIWNELRQFDGKSDDELPRLMLSDEQRYKINEYYCQLVKFISITQSDNDLRAPILRSRLNLYRILMIIAVLRRHEAMGTAEGMFDDKVFTTTEADLNWALTYIFYLTMQTSTMYNRLRREVKEEAPKNTYLSALAFSQLLPLKFTTSDAVEIGKQCGMSASGVNKKLAKLCKEFFISRVGKGVFVKLPKNQRNSYKQNCPSQAA